MGSASRMTHFNPGAGVGDQRFQPLGEERRVRKHERRIETIDDQARLGQHRLFVGDAAIHRAAGRIHIVQQRIVRPRNAIKKNNQRKHHGEENARQNADGEHAKRCDHCEPELGGSHLPQEAKRRDVDQPERGDDDDGAQRGGGQRRQQRREKEQEDDGQRGGDQPDPLRFAAHLIVDGRARGAERRRKSHQETRADIGHAERHEFLVGVDLLAVFRRKDARGQDLIGVDQDREGQRGRQQRKDILHRDRGDRDLRQAGRHRADHGDPLGRPAQHVRRR